MSLKNPTRATWEIVVLIVIFVVAISFMARTYNLEDKVGKERALMYELAMLRQGVNLFKIVKQRFPGSLVELATASYTLPDDVRRRRFVEFVTVNGDGEIVDPFETPFAYDSAGGWVASQTPGYGSW